MTTGFVTTQPAQMQGLAGYTYDPIFTVGETINGYNPPGILDGMGAYELDANTVRVLANHELRATLGYEYTLANGASIPGARVSYFDIDKSSLEILDSGLAYDTIYNRAGEIVDEASDLEFGGINRLCSANLMEAYQFGDGRGLADRIYFTGEETYGGSQFALDIATNELWALPWFGRAAWESSTEIDTGNTDQVAFIIGDDRGPAPLLLYVGEKDNSADASFLARNGLDNGKVYVWVADNGAADPRDFNGSGNTTSGEFVEIDIYRPDLANSAVDTDGDGDIRDEFGYDAQGFATQFQQDVLSAGLDFANSFHDVPKQGSDTTVGGFLFSRPEDVATDPFDGTRAVLASTGRTSVFEGFDTWGTTYIVDVDFGANDITADLNILYDANEADKQDFGLRSPDNLEWADDGLIYLQEDRAISSSIYGASSGEESSIWSIDPFAADPDATATRVAQMDRSGVPSDQTDGDPDDLGDWESSGIVDVSTLFGNDPGELLLLNVQAHSLRDGNIINKPGIDTDGDGTVEANDNLVQGGQLAFLTTPDATLIQDSEVVSGTPGADVLEAGFDFDGINDNVFSGAGNDLIDNRFGGPLAGGNRLFAGSGEDDITVIDGDRAFGGSGDDVLDASEASGYRISGGAGNDTFFLGEDGRALGGEGDDSFFVLEGGGNIIAGGEGADQFWIFTGDIPAEANTITDFEMGTDVIGIGAAGLTFDDLTLGGNDIMIDGTTVATLNGVNTSSLTAADFAFASL